MLHLAVSTTLPFVAAACLSKSIEKQLADYSKSYMNEGIRLNVTPTGVNIATLNGENQNCIVPQEEHFWGRFANLHAEQESLAEFRTNQVV